MRNEFNLKNTLKKVKAYCNANFIESNCQKPKPFFDVFKYAREAELGIWEKHIDAKHINFKKKAPHK